MTATAFRVDPHATGEGARYDLWEVDGVLHVRGCNVRVTYVSPASKINITGKLRQQRDGRGLGRRAILTLDTGEGVVDLAGVAYGE